MNILFGEAGKKQHAKFTLEINGKMFSYVGTDNEGVLIEDLIFNSLKENMNTDIKFQVIVEMEESVFLISYNDYNPENKEDEPGEDTVVYYFSEFLEEDISTFIMELVNSTDTLVTCEYKEGILSFSSDLITTEEKEFTVLENDIKVTELISTFKKIKNFIKNRFTEIILIIMIILIPLMTINPLKKGIIKNREIKINLLEKEISQLKKDRVKLRRKMKNRINEYRNIKKEKDIMENRKYNYLWEN